jgi:phage terminase large subunit-like protein
MNIAVLVDPAHSKKKGSDYTTFSVIGLHHDNNYYLLDGLRCRYNLAERTAALFALHRRWTPNWIGYERYGLQSDIEHIRYVQEQESYRFGIVELGGAVSKEERIRRLVPVMRQGRFYVPTRLLYTDHEGKTQDYVADFTNELLGFPVGLHDDVIDGVARVLDGELGAMFPAIRQVGAPGLTPNTDKVRSSWKAL